MSSSPPPQTPWLNHFADPLGTSYPNGHPLFDYTTRRFITRDEYCLKNHSLSFETCIRNWQKRTGHSFRSLRKPLSFEQLRHNRFLQENALELNEYGDPVDEIYLLGSPLYERKLKAELSKDEYCLWKYGRTYGESVIAWGRASKVVSCPGMCESF